MAWRSSVRSSVKPARCGTPTRELLEASRLGRSADVQRALTNGANPNARDNNQRTPLICASDAGHLSIVGHLIKAGADVNARDVDGRSALMAALWHRDLSIIKCLLRNSAAVDAADSNGVTALMEACNRNHFELVQYLVTKGANVNDVDTNDETALLKACALAQPYPALVEYLVDRGADVNMPSKTKCKPLHYVLQWSRVDPEEVVRIVELFTAHGAQWDAQCDAILDQGDAATVAPALRECLRLWSNVRQNHLALPSIPIEVITRGQSSTEAYIDDLTGSLPSELIYKHKVCVVGPSRWGKTSLVKSILALAPAMEHPKDRTVGIDLRTWELREGKEPNQSQHVVTFWDMAGQDEYLVAHSLFFSKRTLYLVCVDLRAYSTALMQAELMTFDELKLDGLMDDFVDDTVLLWVRLIVARQPEAELVFVGTKADAIKNLKFLVDEDKTDLNHRFGRFAAERSNNALQAAVNIPERALQPHTNRTQITSSAPTWIVMNCVEVNAIESARTILQQLITARQRRCLMTKTYSAVLEAIKSNMAVLISPDDRVRVGFSEVSSLLQYLRRSVTELTSSKKLEAILHMLHDIGDVLWYDDVKIPGFERLIILDPMLMIEFVRRVVHHQCPGILMANVTLIAQPFWSSLSPTQYLMMKKLLHAFRLVYPTTDTMEHKSDVLVPSIWKAKPCAAGMFAHLDLELGNYLSPRTDIASRVQWEFHFGSRLPMALFDQLVVTSYSPGVSPEVGPDWIELTCGEEHACRFSIVRDSHSLRRVIWLEAIVASTVSDAEPLWRFFRRLATTVKALVQRHGLSYSVCVRNRNERSELANTIAIMKRDGYQYTFMPPMDQWLEDFAEA